jgi:hypothetical protein
MLCVGAFNAAGTSVIFITSKDRGEVKQNKKIFLSFLHLL